MNNFADEFHKNVYNIYAVYLDGLSGFHCWRKQIISDQNTMKNMIVDELDHRKFIYGKGDPNKSDSYPLHISTQGETKERNKEDGQNYRILGNLCIVLIYQYWDFYRKKIASENNIKEHAIKSDLMGDIRYLRNSILKHNGLGNHEMKRCKILKWFKENELIYFDRDKFAVIIYQLFLFTKELNKKYGKQF